MPPIEPLPRSLTPLAGESLHGLILRLSHRLDQAPGHILWRTGLTSDTRSTSLAPKRLLLMLDASEQQRFAAATRLDPETVDQLTLRRYFATHPSLAKAMARPGQSPRQRFIPPTWLLFANPRHCPECLAGDGSEIQRRHGGAWKLQWHLPIVFACLEHTVFLQHRCPGCRQRGDSLDRRITTRLIASPGASGLHPAQCRRKTTEAHHASLCPHRLDSFDPPRVELPPELERLQLELLALLEDTADPRRSLGRLSDLRHLSAIICATWPHSRRGDLPPAVTRTLSTDLRRPAQPGSDSRTDQHRWDSAPPSALVGLR
ncbi:TniQ family protein [Streptomyces sp. NBC_00989]|uniref:TniQ family protein n=1 Tax=Streptomyces sp. NBC_00989 TaxID=2903705 RepID=UPI00386BDE50|nr:TniQ family protein [Streptomyces sp. NBC_00989]